MQYVEGLADDQTPPADIAIRSPSDPQALAADWPPRTILHLDIELAGLERARDLIEALREFLDSARSPTAEVPERAAIFLDELTRVDNWAGGIRAETLQAYREAIVGEFTRAGMRESYLREVINWVARHLGQEFDYRDVRPLIRADGGFVVTLNWEGDLAGGGVYGLPATEILAVLEAPSLAPSRS